MLFKFYYKKLDNYIIFLSLLRNEKHDNCHFINRLIDQSVILNKKNINKY
jgi:hypothetical protein